MHSHGILHNYWPLRFTDDLGFHSMGRMTVVLEQQLHVPTGDAHIDHTHASVLTSARHLLA